MCLQRANRGCENKNFSLNSLRPKILFSRYKKIMKSKKKVLKSVLLCRVYRATSRFLSIKNLIHNTFLRSLDYKRQGLQKIRRLKNTLHKPHCLYFLDLIIVFFTHILISITFFTNHNFEKIKPFNFIFFKYKTVLG